MSYPFENTALAPHQKRDFERMLPHVCQVMPEFFRVMSVASLSIQQRNMFGHPSGIRRDLGMDDAFRTLMLACFEDGLISEATPSDEIMDIFKRLALNWYLFGNNIDACIYLGYYFYEQYSTAIHLIRELKKQVGFLSSIAGNQRQALLIVDELLPGTASKRWYRTEHGIGDKRFPIFISQGDFTRTDLPRPGFQIHFRASKIYDLRAPVFIDADAVEEPQVKGDKLITRCPSCEQRCRAQIFPWMELRCPVCQTLWRQRA
jgi:hypothetical protein